MDVSKAYAGVPELLRLFIDNKDIAAWNEIVCRIDYIRSELDSSLTILNTTTGFIKTIQREVAAGKKLLYKPNLVGPSSVDFITHGEGPGAPICTDWTFLAALMRWFHDTAEISYYQMSMGEGSASAGLLAGMLSQISGMTITPEGIFEGKNGETYGGWGFYFIRKYLSDTHPPDHTDNPMNGHKESVAGTYFPPGMAGDRLMVYDLNNVHDDPQKGREVPVRDGANFKSITLHKVIIGGDPDDTEDLKKYPGSILINVPKLKLHLQDLITNSIKNIGIGLYPMQCSSSQNEISWKYASPDTGIPTLKSKLPHTRQMVLMDDRSNLPVQDEHGEYRITMTAGMAGTQADVIRATMDQNVFMVHVVDAIDIINLSHDPDGRSVRIPEGYSWASLDCVALDLFCARYCFKTVPMKEGLKLKEENGWNTEFVHHVPVAAVKGPDIVTEEGLDSPLFRYHLYSYAQSRGIGQLNYYIAGWDSITQTSLVSVDGHLGRVQNTTFHELMTSTMYYNASCMLWDMQKTILSYAQAHDTLTGTSLVREFMDQFDENNDGVIDYDENGRCGFWSISGIIAGYCHSLHIRDPYGSMKSCFIMAADLLLRPSDKNWNPHGHTYAMDVLLMNRATLAYDLSKSDVVTEDSFIPTMRWGKGMWPSWKTASYLLYLGAIYGASSPDSITLQSLYGAAFQYADKTLARGIYTRDISQRRSDPEAINTYFSAILGGAEPLDFILYVPRGYGTIKGDRIPNVQETDDPSRIFTAHFNQGKEIW